jgi:hypothetical protein
VPPWREHDPEEWKPVSRLREAVARSFERTVASAGEGRSEKIMLNEDRDHDLIRSDQVTI